MDDPSPKRRNRKAHETHEALVDRALALYQPRTTLPLDREDGREIIHNLSGFLSVLAEWKRREQAASLPGAAK